MLDIFFCSCLYSPHTTTHNEGSPPKGIKDLVFLPSSSLHLLSEGQVTALPNVSITTLKAPPFLDECRALRGIIWLRLIWDDQPEKMVSVIAPASGTCRGCGRWGGKELKRENLGQTMKGFGIALVSTIFWGGRVGQGTGWKPVAYMRKLMNDLGVEGEW